MIVGVNKYRLKEEALIDTLDVDNHAVRDGQIARLKTLRAKRDDAAVMAALNNLNLAAKDGSGNLLDLSIKAVRQRATVGEISDALESAWSRHRAINQTVSGVYSAAYGDGDEDKTMNEIRGEIDSFAAANGRRPRLMIAKLGQDGHDRGAKVVATAFADLGFDVDVGPLFQTPAEAARQSVENDVHAIGVSTLAAGHKTLVPELVKALQALGANDIVVFVGGVIPAQDYAELFAAGAAAIFGPGTPIPESARAVLAAISARLAAAS